jgi:hypothetical protein
MGLGSGLRKLLGGAKSVAPTLPKTPLVGAQDSAAKLLQNPSLFKVKGPTGPMSPAQAARADLRTRLASVKTAAMLEELEKISQDGIEKEDAFVGERQHPIFSHKADFLKHMRGQSSRPPALPTPALPSVPSAPKGKGGLLQFVKGLAVKAKRRIMP